MKDDSEAQARREAHYSQPCWCGHPLGNHSPLTGECMQCDHIKARREIQEHERRMARYL